MLAQRHDDLSLITVDRHRGDTSRIGLLGDLISRELLRQLRVKVGSTRTQRLWIDPVGSCRRRGISHRGQGSTRRDRTPKVDGQTSKKQRGNCKAENKQRRRTSLRPGAAITSTMRFAYG